VFLWSRVAVTACYTGPEKLEAGAGRATRAHKNSKLTENPFLSGLRCLTPHKTEESGRILDCFGGANGGE